MEDTAESSVDEFIGETLPPPPPLPKLDPASLSLLPIRPHSSLSSSLLASSSPRGLLTSSCLNELDLSAPPFGDDLPDEPHDSFRSKVLLALDNVKGLALCLHALATASDYSGNWRLPSETWRDTVTFPVRSSVYLVRLATHVSIPALHISLGIGAVLTLASRKSRGQHSWRLWTRAIRAAVVLMVLNEVSMLRTIIRSRGKALWILLPLWSLGVNLFVVETLLLLLGAVDRFVVFIYLRFAHIPTQRSSHDRYFSISSPRPRPPDAPLEDPAASDDDRTPLLRPTILPKLFPLLEFLHRTTDLVLLAGAVAMLVVNVVCLPDRDAPDERWRIGGEMDERTWWYWFLVAPTPTTWDEPYQRLVSEYAPLSWLPFTLLGAIVGRYLIRRRRPYPSLAFSSLLLSLLFSLLFLLTRLVPSTNLSRGYIPSSTLPSPTPPRPDPPAPSPSPSQPRSDRAFYFSSWQPFLLTTRYPPDPAFFFLTSTLFFLLSTLSLLIPSTWLSRSPLVQFGRTVASFLVVQLLGFHYVVPAFLALLDWPRRLDLWWTVVVWAAGLPLGWIISEAVVVWKDRMVPDTLWRIL